MKINIKALELIEKGLSSKTVSKLNESQVEILHNRLCSEQVTEIPAKKTLTQTVFIPNSPQAVSGTK